LLRPISPPTHPLSSRPERPDFFLRVGFLRVGPRSGGIVAKLPRFGCSAARRLVYPALRCPAAFTARPL